MKRPAPMFALLALSLTLSLNAFAGTVFKSGDWQLDDSLPNDPAKGTCQAMTAGYFGNAVTYLAVVVDKTGARPMEVFVLPNRPSIGATAMVARTDSGKTWYFPKLVRTGTNDQYWQIPVNTVQFVEDLKQGNQLNIGAVSGSNEHL